MSEETALVGFLDAHLHALRGCRQALARGDAGDARDGRLARVAAILESEDAWEMRLRRVASGSSLEPGDAAVPAALEAEFGRLCPAATLARLVAAEAPVGARARYFQHQNVPGDATCARYAMNNLLGGEVFTVQAGDGARVDGMVNLVPLCERWDTPSPANAQCTEQFDGSTVHAGFVEAGLESTPVVPLWPVDAFVDALAAAPGAGIVVRTPIGAGGGGHWTAYVPWGGSWYHVDSLAPETATLTQPLSAQGVHEHMSRGLPRGDSLAGLLDAVLVLHGSSSALPLRGAVPAVGLGTADLLGAQCHDAVRHALSSGYRHVDTAEMYGNEEAVGRALQGHAGAFVTTKLTAPFFAAGAEVVRGEVAAQRARLGRLAVDLYLLHEPGAAESDRLAAWRVLEERHSEGELRSLGLSNFDCDQASRLEREARVPVAAVQNKFDPYHPGGWLDGEPHGGRFARTPVPPGLDVGDGSEHYCSAGDATYVAYSTLSGWPFLLQPVRDPHVVAVGREVGRSPSQVLLRWALQLGAAVLPRSASPARIAENAAVFDFTLPPSAMRRISGLAWLVGHTVVPPPTDDELGVRAVAEWLQ